MSAVAQLRGGRSAAGPRARHALRSRCYVVLMRGLGGLLLAYALLLLYEGGRRLAAG